MDYVNFAQSHRNRSVQNTKVLYIPLHSCLLLTYPHSSIHLIINPSDCFHYIRMPHSSLLLHLGGFKVHSLKHKFWVYVNYFFFLFHSSIKMHHISFSKALGSNFPRTTHSQLCVENFRNMISNKPRNWSDPRHMV